MIRRILASLQRRRRTRTRARADRELPARFVHASAVVARFLPASVVATFDGPEDGRHT
jgi:hypothetical protein